jgi:peptidoglycan/xylan/chitin deacetylase (PgdA/CDA1 family)
VGIFPTDSLATFAFLFLVYFQKTCYEVPILMYHHVDYSPGPSGVYVTPENFERQMEFLKVHRYNVMELSEVVRRARSGEGFPRKTVAITFDDGYLDNLTNAFPVLKKMDFPATIFMITSNVGREGWLSEEDLRILDGSAVRIGSHTAHHAFLPNITYADARAELTDSKKELERILKRPVTLFSYPAGGVTAALENLVMETGYDGAVTTNYMRHRHDPFALHRIKISDGSANLFNFWIKTGGYYSLGKRRIDAKPLTEPTGGVMGDE